MISKTFIVAAMALPLSLASAASMATSLSDDELSFIHQSVPGTSDWHETAPGLFEGRTRDGGIVRFYTNAAHDLYLAEREAQLSELIKAAEEDEAIAESLRGAIEAIESELGGHAAIREAELEAGALKNTQEFAPTFSTRFCSRISYPKSTFYHFWYSANTTADFPALGSGPQFGPPPPLPQSVYRYVHAQTGSNLDWIDEHWINGGPFGPTQQPLSAYASAIVFPNSCSMETHHSISVLCHDGSSQAGAVTVQQTCSGVTNGIPPTQLP